MNKRIPKITDKDPKLHLKETLLQAAIISENNIQKILNIFEVVKYDKNQQIIKEGTVAEYMYFISKGLVRVYYFKTGKEIIDWFAEEGSFIGNLYSHITTKPGFDIYEAMEDVTLLRVKFNDLEKLYKESHEIESLSRKIMEQYYITYVERVHNLRALPSDEKYHLFLKYYAPIINRIPLKFVAIYLGITAETLSRIRAK